MTGGTKIKEVDADNDFWQSEDESGGASRASSTGRRKKKSSGVSTTGSTCPSVKRRAGKKKAMKKADNIMSDLTGMSSHSTDNFRQTKKEVTKKKPRTLDEHFGRRSEDSTVLDDGVSCLTDNSKSTRGTALSKNSKGTKGTKDTSRSKKKKKRSPSKKSQKGVENSEDPEYSPTDKSVSSKRSKNQSKRRRSVSSRRSTHGDDKSASKKSNKPNNLSKLNKRDKLDKTKSNYSLTSPVNSSSHSRDDDSKRGVRRSKSLPLNGKPSTPSSRSSSKKNAVKPGKDGVKLKILPDGTVKKSVPRRSKSFDKNNHSITNQIDEGSDSDSVSLSDSSDDERRLKGSLLRLKEMGIVTKRSFDKESSSITGSSRRNPPPTRSSGRGSVVRSASADHVQEMQRHLARGSRNESFENPRNSSTPNTRNARLYLAPSPREAPTRRGVNRNSSAPLRSAMRTSSSYSGTFPTQQRPGLRSSKSAHFQRQTPERRTSKGLSTAEHVEILKGLTMGTSSSFDNSQRRRPSFDENSQRRRPSFEDNSQRRRPSFDDNSQRRRSSFGDNSQRRRPSFDNSQRRRSSGAALANRTLSPNEFVRNSSHRSACSFSSRESIGRNSILNHPSGSDLDPGDREGSMVLNQKTDDYGSENESLNDSGHEQIVDMRDMSRTRSKKNTRSSSDDGSLFGYSTHSMRSNRSQMSIDKPEPFENDPKWKAALRYLYLLPPHKNESKLKKKIRIFTWISMLLDFIAATVAVVQYQGSTSCCGEPIYDIMFDLNWDVLFRVITYLYMVMILAEIVPVIKNGMPFNIINPAIGLIITFGMFFDDSIAEAVAMWVIEAMAIFFEFMVYRVNARVFFETSFKLNQVDEEIEALKKKRKEFVEMLQEGGSMHGSRHRNGSRHRSRDGSKHNPKYELEMGRSYDDEDDDSLSGHSFGDEDFPDEIPRSGPSFGSNDPPPPRVAQIRRTSKLKRTHSRDSLGCSIHSNAASAAVTGITVNGGRIRLPGEIKQNKLLRKRRMLRENKKAEAKELYYHFVGSMLNIGLAVIALIFIITIASTGGLCFNGNSVDVFSFQQLEKCNKTNPENGYMSCDSEPNQCYFAYY